MGIFPFWMAIYFIGHSANLCLLDFVFGKKIDDSRKDLIVFMKHIYDWINKGFNPINYGKSHVWNN